LDLSTRGAAVVALGATWKSLRVPASVLSVGAFFCACAGSSDLRSRGQLEALRVGVLADEDNEWVANETGRGAAMAVVDSGHVAVLDVVESRVVIVDTAGRQVQTLGRKGPGPGEFLNPRFLTSTSSGLAVYDDLKLGIVEFDLQDGSIREVRQESTFGPVGGVLTGMAFLADGSVVYAVSENTRRGMREALYVHQGAKSRLLVHTPEAPSKSLRLSCGIVMRAGPPIFWPTLRWAATGSKVAYAATDLDRVVVWDQDARDSTVLVGTETARSATVKTALRFATPLTVTTPGRQCSIEPTEVLRQRGMAALVPPIDRVAISPAGVVWSQLTSEVNGGERRVVLYDRDKVDSLYSGAFPSVFLSNSRFVAEESRNGRRLIAVWEVRRR